MSTIRFDDRVAIVTGAGNGLGRSHALELARRGAKVVVNDLGGSVDGRGGSAGPADAVVAEIIEAGGQAVANADSVSTPEGGEAIVQAALDAFGTVDIVINNAGILRDRAFANLGVDDLNAVIDVHLKGAFHVSQPAFRVMKQKGYGRLLFTASASGIFGNFGQSNYGAAKMGLVGLMNVLAIEGAKYGITANAIAPMAGTRMTQDLLGEAGRAFFPEHVTAMAAYLVSEGCTLTHEVFSVGGGHMARVFVGLTPGWTAEHGAVPTLEEVAGHIETIRDQTGYTVPASLVDELSLLYSAVRSQ